MQTEDKKVRIQKRTYADAERATSEDNRKSVFGQGIDWKLDVFFWVMFNFLSYYLPEKGI